MALDAQCYTFKKIVFTDGLLNDSVDATYILHLEGNGRLPNIEKQLLEYHPTNLVYIVFNKGFKKCNKNLHVQSSMYDITHANLEVLKHSKLHNYSNILILEDDFIFDSNIKQVSHINNINKFINNNNNKTFIYHLGALPFIVFPYNLTTYYSYSLAAHASIFSKGAQEYIINTNTYYIKDWDVFLLNNIRRYIYYIPLCNQTFPNTENKQNWDQPLAVQFFSNKFIDLVKFDTQPEPGTSIVYIFSKLLSLFLFIFILYILYFILSYLKIFNFFKRKYTFIIKHYFSK